MKNVLFLATVVALASARAAVEFATPFGDGMVLQRDRPVPVWGAANVGATVEVRFADQVKAAVADSNGSWKVTLDPMPASKTGQPLVAAILPASNQTIEQSNNRTILSDVLVGEVWIVSGQSNCELPLVGESPHFSDRQGLLVANMTRQPNIRFAYASTRAWSREERRELRQRAVWKPFLPKCLKEGKSFSAMGVYFALDLYAALDIPVGLIGVYLGATRIEPWIPREAFANLSGFEWCRDWTYIDNKDWKPLTGRISMTYPSSQPCGLWNDMVAPWTPMSVRGVVWYQGCSNSTRSGKDEGDDYRRLMHTLYDSWSARFANPDLKFYFVQLAPFANWWDIQLAQARFAAEEENAAMVTACDVGNSSDIHPNEKGTIGKRLAAVALRHAYGFTDLVADAPTLARCTADGERVKLDFADAHGWWLYNANWSVDVAFELAGTNGVWKTARLVNTVNGYTNSVPWKTKGKIDGGGTLILAAPGVDKPVRVRYLHERPWAGYLYSTDSGLPLGPFEASVDGRDRPSPTNRSPFLVSTACKWPIFGDSGWRRANLEAAAREFPEWKWIYGEPNTIDKMLRLGFNSVNLFALPAERFAEPRTLECFLRQMKVVAEKGVPFYLDLHTGRSTVPGRVRAAMSGDVDVESLFHNKAGSTFGIPFRLTDEKAVEAYVRMYVHDAKAYKEMGLKPWAYKLLNEATYGDKACDLEQRERLTADVIRRLHDALREVEPDVPSFVQIHNRAWRSNWNGIDLYSMTRPLEIISIGTGGFCYPEGDRVPAGTRFADAEEPGDSILDDLGAIAFYRALAHGKPIVASELYFPGRTGNRSRELEATLWHAAAEGISMVNLWEWGSIRTKPSSASYALYNPHSCAPETWTELPRMVAEIESLSDFFPVGARRETTRVAVLFSNPTRRRNPAKTIEFCRAVAALELSHIRADAIFEEQLVPGEDCRIGDYDVILDAGATDFLPTTRRALADWEQRGGTLVKVDTSLPLYRMAVGLKEIVSAKGIRPIAEVRDVATDDEAPSVRVFKAKSGALTGWMLANYSDTARLVTVAADELRGVDCAAIQPFGTNAWPLADGRMTVLVPERFHALAVTGPRAELARRFGQKKPVSSDALASARDLLIAESVARAPKRESVTVDLKPFVNGAFDNQQGWSIPIVWADGCGSDLKGVPYHAQTYRHIVFDVIRFDYNGNRTTLAMRSEKRPDGLERTPDIGLGGRPLRGIAVLGAVTHARPGETAATMEVSYVDGTKERFPLRTGIELGSWKVADNAEGKRDDCVWKNRDGFGLFVCEWENPRPSDPVSHFNLVGGSGESAANVVAVSALPSRFGKRYCRRIDLAEGVLSLPKGKTERLSVKPEDVSADGVLRLELSHPRGRFGSSAKFSGVGAYLVGRTAAGERISTYPHGRTTVCDAFKRQMRMSVASADEWAEIEIPLAMMTLAMGADGRTVEMTSVEEVVLNEQSNGDHLYRKVRVECGTVAQASPGSSPNGHE